MSLHDQSLCQLIILPSNRILLYGLRTTLRFFFSAFLTLQYRERRVVLDSSELKNFFFSNSRCRDNLWYVEHTGIFYLSLNIFSTLLFILS